MKRYTAEKALRLLKAFCAFNGFDADFEIFSGRAFANLTSVYNGCYMAIIYDPFFNSWIVSMTEKSTFEGGGVEVKAKNEIELFRQIYDKVMYFCFD